MSNRKLSKKIFFLEKIRFGRSVDNDIKNKFYHMNMCDNVVAFVYGHTVLLFEVGHE
jgi:hypothetical protein